MRIAVSSKDHFSCPVCGVEYEIEPHEDGVAIVSAREGYCRHLDLEIFPTPSGWEVYFLEEVE